MPLSPVTKGVLACLTAALLWATNGVASKFLMNGGLSPFALAQGRVTYAAALTVLWLALTRPAALRLERRHILHFLLLGSGGMAAVNACYLSAVARIPTGAAVLLQYMAPALIALYAWGFMEERMRPIKVLALLVAFGGCYLVVGGYDMGLLSLNRWGVLWGLGAAVSFAFLCIYSEYGLRDYSPWTVLCYGLAVASVIWNLIMGPAKLLSIGWDGRSWGLLFYSASAGTVVPFGLFTYGIDRLRATRATIVSMSEPIAAALIAYAWLGETLEGLQVLGGILVLAAVIMIQKEREQDRLTPALLKEAREASG